VEQNGLDILSPEEAEMLGRVVKLGRVYQSFGWVGSEWAFPIPGSGCVDPVNIDKNDLFRNIALGGFMASRPINIPGVHWLVWSPNDKTLRLFGC